LDCIDSKVSGFDQLIGYGAMTLKFQQCRVF